MLRGFTTPLTRHLAAVAGFALVFAALWLAPPHHPFEGLASYLPLHTFLETFSIVISFLVFGVVWNAWTQERPGSIVNLAAAFFAVGSVDFLHMLSYAGMPAFVTPGSPEKAIFFWLVARLLAALALLTVALRPWRAVVSTHRRYANLAGAGVLIAVTAWVGLYHLDAVPRTFVEGRGLTSFKVGTEYLLCALFLAAAVLFCRRAIATPERGFGKLFVAAAVSVLSEMSFTLYSDVTDLYNLVGHVYKVIAYGYIYQAVFVTCVRQPFQALHAADAEILALNAQLEQRVAARTAQLQEANRDLETFAYSVSHDLRAPLRAIDGFSRILLDTYDAKLDEEGKRLLKVVCDNTTRMDVLIEDILQFSRTGRQAFNPVEVDMAALVREAWDDLCEARAGRNLRLELGPLPAACGDRAALGQVLANLLGNAVKFTAGRDPALIEVGGRTENKHNIYYVKDNGVGFDMAYAGKLFGVFQRLHGPDEFPGSGIGLAVVKRFVAKHGGRVWAEGAIDKGAIFYFVLPRREPCDDSGERHDTSQQ